ncbi:MAG: esterase/lipase family protein [Methylotenera sp.]|jgi:pimeloyl-ACP methyl ester carboxylesterase
MLRLTFKALRKTFFSKYTIAIVVLLVVFVAGVIARSHVFAPDLHRLYMESMMVEDQPPVIFIHGVLGSKLRDIDSKKDLWPGGVSRLLLHDYADIAYEINPETLEPLPSKAFAYAISDGAAGKDFYGKIVRTLSETGGYKLSRIGEKINPRQKNYYVFHYDWRQDNVISAGQLADFIEQIRLDYQNPNLKVDIVAHSMGGLITRYYLRYGKQDVIGDNHFDEKLNMVGAERVRRVILLGTPNLGSVKTLNLFIQGVDIGVNQIGTETLASMPSLYQLFPHPLVNWIVKSDGSPLERDLFDVNIWKRFQWSIFDPKVRQRILDRFEDKQAGEQYLLAFDQYFEKHLERARRFVWSLSVPLPKNHTKLTIFGGGCTLTPARIIVEEVAGESMVRMFPKEITQPIKGIDYDALLLEPGDGSVTKASLLGRNTLDPSVKRSEYIHVPIKQSFFLCESHNSLTGNLNFQDNLLNTLLTRDALE